MGTLVVSMAASNVAPYAPLAATTVQAATGTKVNVVFVDENGNTIKEETQTVDEDGDGMFKFSELTLPDGYELNGGGDQFTGEESYEVPVTETLKAAYVTITFETKDGEVIEKVTPTPKKAPAGEIVYYVLGEDFDLPEGYKLAEGMMTTIEFPAGSVGGPTLIVEKIQTGTQINVTFVDAAGNNVGGGDVVVDEDGDGIFKYDELNEIVPDGYKLTAGGDQFVSDYAGEGKSTKVTVEKIQKGTQINVTFVDAAGTNVGGGDVLVDADGDGIFNLNEVSSILPEGYKLVLGGDQFVSDYAGEGKSTELTVEKIQKGTIINVVFEDRQGNNLGGGDYLVDEDGDGVANYSELDLPAGYKLIETGDFFVKDAADGMTVVLDRDGSAIIHVVFKSEGGKNLGGGDYFVDEDGDGVFNYSELDLPVGYELIVTGDEFVDTDKTYEITLHKINAGTIINVVFVDEEGNNLGGGDYFVDMDDDGIANFSELDVPEGYKLVVTGDFFVADYTGQTNEIKVEKIQKGTIINVVFEDRQGNNLGGGDYLVDEDGDGVANYSELDLPAGYKLIETGDFFVKDAADGMTVVLDRDGSAIIHVVFKSEGGKNLGGGDYFVDEDGDGVFNYSELDLPVGYELIVTGDEFVDTDKTYEITLHKINAGTIINVVFVDEEGNNLGGGDYFVDMDDDGIANFSELTLPEGYELIVTGDFFVDEYVGHSNTIVLKKIEVIRDASLRVTFETTDGKKVWATKMMTKEGVEGEDVVFSLGEDFHLPLFFKLAEGVDQITDITIPAGSVGGHTMIVEPIFDVRLPKLQLHLKQ